MTARIANGNNQEYFFVSPEEFIEYKNELSVFCFRDISTGKFLCSSIVGKKLLSVIGDGTHTIAELIMNNQRAYLQIERLRERWGDKLKKVLKKGEEFFLIENANHSKGAIFYKIDDSTKQIEQIIINISKGIRGFNYGRYDIMYDNIEGLLAGNYSIIELNGVGAEPIDMYIPKLPLWKGLSILIFHWKKMYEIANHNMKKMHFKPINKKEGFSILQKHKKYKGKELW
jgi:hypothetical protein